LLTAAPIAASMTVTSPWTIGPHLFGRNETEGGSRMFVSRRGMTAKREGVRTRDRRWGRSIEAKPF
jgi:hypothetical protein